MSLFEKERILVPIDFSDISFDALREAIDFTADPTRVYVLHVVPHLEATDPGMIWQSESVSNDSRKEHVQQAFDSKMEEMGLSGVHFSTAIGDPSSEIIDYATTQGIDLIVLPSKGKTGIERFLLGSVAERVVRHAHCPVLVLRS
ncbi:MAG: universal stress protein [Kaiparowitsia implicata GSE-PSE-MK54-09C]|jgi:nucleotide-binding universal stress UspA family protein|nr:universal stress protein [Kaiparowitsia implicata GSE-PSE-MK54-09C]